MASLTLARATRHSLKETELATRQALQRNRRWNESVHLSFTYVASSDVVSSIVSAWPAVQDPLGASFVLLFYRVLKDRPPSEGREPLRQVRTLDTKNK